MNTNKKTLFGLDKLQSKKMRNKSTFGFTLIEMLVVAPIVLLVIGVFIAAIINITGEVLSTRSANNLSYNIQDALNRIEQDVKLSGGFLSTNNITLTSPQGYNNDTTNFHNIDATAGTILILNSYATTNNPLGSVPDVLYTAGQPNPCDSTLINKNKPLMINIIYFVKDGSLWRRTIAPSNYETVGCSKPWQQPSCAQNISGALCKTTDLQLIEGIDANTGFTIRYYPDVTSTTENTIANDSNQTDEARQLALKSTNTASISITATTTTAGRSVTQSGSIRATSQNNNFDPTLVSVIAPTILSQPQNKTVLHGENVEISVTAAGTSPTVQWQQSTNQGSTWTNISGATSTNLSITAAAATMDGYQYRAIFTNSAGSVTSTAARLTVNSLIWTNLTLQNNWTAYNSNSGYATPSYRKTSDGVVILKGVISNPGTPTDGQIITTLPESYRPSGTLIFAASTAPNAYARLDIDASGRIIYRAGGNASWISLDNIRFVPDTGRYARNSITNFQNGWTNFGSPFAPVSYVIDNSERVNIQGVMNTGTLTNGTVIFNVPTNLISPLYMHIPAAGGSFGAFGISDTVPGILAKGSGSSWMSLQTMYYPATYSTWSNLTLQNSWVYYGSIFSTPQYTKAADGLVTLKGLVGSGTATAGTVVATLPAGYQPSNNLLFTGLCGNAYCRIDIDASGNIIFGSGSNVWLSLDNITFYADK